MSLGIFLPLQFFEHFKMIGVNSLNVSWNLPVTPSGPGFSVLENHFDHSFSFSTCNWSVHIFYFVLVQSWELFFNTIHKN